MGRQAATKRFRWELLSTELRDKIFDRLSDGYASNAAHKINPWELLLTELRDLIFDHLSDGYANENDYFGVSCRCDHHIAVPPLLIALRNLPRSYHDALQRFKAANGTLATYLYLGPNDLSRLTLTELQAFQYLRYKIPRLADLYNSRRWAATSNRFLWVPYIPRDFTQAKNLSYLRIDFNSHANENTAAAMAFMTEFPFFLSHFRYLRAMILELPTWCENHLRRKRIVHGMIRRIASRLQAKVTCLYNHRHNPSSYLVKTPPISWCFKDGQLVDTLHPRGYEVWIWGAEKGRTMDWSQVAHMGIPYTPMLYYEYNYSPKVDNVFDAGFYLAFIEDQFLLHDGDYDHSEGYLRYAMDYGYGHWDDCLEPGHGGPNGWPRH